MTDRPLAAPDDLAIEVPIELRREDSLHALLAPVRPFSTVLMLLTLGSLAVHAVVVATAVVSSQLPVAAETTEIPIEIVQEPKPPPKAAMEAAKAGSAKPEPSKEVAKAETPKADAQKPAEPVQVPPPKPVEPQQEAKAEHRQPAEKRPDARKDDVDALQKELAELKAEQAALHTRASERAAAASDEALDGPLAGSRQAIALPGASASGDDVVAYQDIVFSQLAKAKGLGEYHGAEGTTRVRFAIDESGQLVAVEISVSSGNPQLDAEALAIVRRAAPFPAPPKDSERTFVANVNFVPPKQK